MKSLLTQLLKWQFQPTLRGTSWRLTVEEQRREVADHLADNPSLKGKLPDAMASAYGGAILAGARETGLGRDVFPPECPWSFDEAMSGDFWPGDEQ